MGVNQELKVLYNLNKRGGGGGGVPGVNQELKVWYCIKKTET